MMNERRAGWYRDDDHPLHHRFWDGVTWGELQPPLPAAAVAAPPPVTPGSAEPFDTEPVEH